MRSALSFCVAALTFGLLFGLLIALPAGGFILLFNGHPLLSLIPFGILVAWFGFGYVKGDRSGWGI